MRKYILLILLITNFIFSQSNSIITGKVIEEKNNEPIPFASVYVTIPTPNSSDTNDVTTIKGTTTDFDGNYKLEIPAGSYTFHITSIGFENVEKKITIKENEEIRIDSKMLTLALQINEFVYSENKNATKAEESTISISVIKPSVITNRNITSGDAAVDLVPGITVVDSEPQIRGASGFTAGLGSKVLIMIDDIPMLRGDAGRPEWNFLPLENMDQIEVIKGAGSVLYGSGASNGVVNIRTAYPKIKPEFMVTAFAGIYNDPSDPRMRVYGKMNPIKAGFNFYHSRIFKSNKLDVDFVVGGQFLYDMGYRGAEPDSFVIFGVPQKFDKSRINEGEYDKGGRFNFNTRFRLKGVQGLSFGINGNFYYVHQSQSYFYLDADTNIFRMAPGSLTNFKNFMFYVDPYLLYVSKKNDKISFRNRIFQSYSDADIPQDTRSTTIYNEFVYNKSFKDAPTWRWLLKDLNITLGASNTYIYSAGEVFINPETPDNSSTSINTGAYLQIDKNFFKRLSLSLGTRVEYFNVNGFNTVKPIFRAGLNVKLTEVTFIRLSAGQGFRFPTIGERYITTSSGGFAFVANPNLLPESSWNFELGAKQMFGFGKKFVGYFDIAGFLQYYDNFVEFAAGTYTLNGTPTPGFKFFNTGKSRIWGIDAMMFLQYKIKKDINVDLICGYTYSMPQTLDPNFSYDGTPGKTYRLLSSDTTDNILKYRIRHQLKFDLNVEIKNFYFGFTTKYYGPMENIDYFFISLDNANLAFNGITNFMQNQNNGVAVFDIRASYKIKKFKVGFIVENLMNIIYSVRPLGVQAPRLMTLQLTYKI